MTQLHLFNIKALSIGVGPIFRPVFANTNRLNRATCRNYLWKFNYEKNLCTSFTDTNQNKQTKTQSQICLGLWLISSHV